MFINFIFIYIKDQGEVKKMMKLCVTREIKLIFKIEEIRKYLDGKGWKILNGKWWKNLEFFNLIYRYQETYGHYEVFIL